MKSGCQQLFAVICFAILGWIGSAASGQQIQWAADLAAAKTEAARRGKPILLHFGASWCRPCQEVETFVFRNPAVMRKLGESVVPVRVDYDRNPQLAAEFGVKSLPMDVVITTSEKVIQKRNSPTEASAYIAMLGEIDRAQTSLVAGGEATLKEKNQLAESWEQSRPRAPDSMSLTPFDQQRPMVPAPKPPESPAVIAARTSPAASAVSAVAGTSATVTSALTAEARPRTSSAAPPPGKQSAPAPAAPKTVTNPFAAEPTQPRPQPAVEQSGSDPTAGLVTPATAEMATSPESTGNVMLTSGTIGESPLALEGDCPVTLLKATKWTRGDEQYGAVHRGKLYLFVSSEAQAEFLRDPEAYSPLLAGYDPVLFHDRGELVDGNKAHGVFMTREGKQRVVLFQSAETQARFRANPLVYLEAIKVATEQADGKR